MNRRTALQLIATAMAAPLGTAVAEGAEKIQPYAYILNLRHLEDVIVYYKGHQKSINVQELWDAL